MTSLTPQEDVAARLQAEARHTGRSFKAIVNDHLRRSLAQRTRAKQIAPFRVLTQTSVGRCQAAPTMMLQCCSMRVRGRRAVKLPDANILL